MPGHDSQKLDRYANDDERLHPHSVALSGEGTDYFAERELQYLLAHGVVSSDVVVLSCVLLLWPWQATALLRRAELADVAHEYISERQRPGRASLHHDKASRAVLGTPAERMTAIEPLTQSIDRSPKTR